MSRQELLRSKGISFLCSNSYPKGVLLHRGQCRVYSFQLCRDFLVLLVFLGYVVLGWCGPLSVRRPVFDTGFVLGGTLHVVGQR